MKLFGGIVVALLLGVGLSLNALAQQNSTTGPGPAFQQGSEKQVTPEQFAAMKSHMLKMIEARQARLNEEKTCAMAATTPAELRQCRPERPMGRGPGMRGQRGPGPQQPPQQPAGQQ